MTLEEALFEVYETLGVLPTGYRVTVDESSKCILIANNHLGFAMTPVSYEHGVDAKFLMDHYLHLQNMTKELKLNK